MQTLLEILVSILPVFVFLTFLLLFDSFKLVKWRNIMITIGIGSAAALLCLLISTLLLTGFNVPPGILTRYIAPVIEETAKAGYIVFLLRKKKIGFMVDGAIYGFAIGAGFAVIENIYYLHSLVNKQLIVWVIRGLGTAVMHGGTTAIFTIISKNLEDRLRKRASVYLIPGFLAAVIVHSFFNHFFLRPAIMTVGQLIILPVLVTLVYIRSEKHLRSWLEIGLDTDVSVLEYITSGRLSETRIGRYLQSIMDQFPGEIMADMLCYLRIYLELSICAKGALLMQESGFKIPRDREVEDKIRELNFLEKSIGQTGKRAIAPLVQKSARDMWQIYLLS